MISGLILVLFEFAAGVFEGLIPASVPVIGTAAGGGRQPLTWWQTFWAVFCAIIAAAIVMTVGSLILFGVVFAALLDELM